MKGILAISIALNLALAAWLIWLPARDKSQPAEGLPQPTNAFVKSDALAPGDQPTGGDTLAMDQAQSLSWEKIASEDLRSYCWNLRDLGCPEHIVRAIILANDTFRKESIPLARKMGRRYWEKVVTIKTPRDVPEIPEELEARSKLGALYLRREQAMRELFGDDWKWPQRDPFERNRERRAAFSFVSSDKLPALLEWDARRSESVMAVHRLRLSDEERQVELETIQTLLDAEGKRLLSPDEWKEYQLRVSQSSRVPSTLYGVKMTEEEMRQLVSILDHYVEGPRAAASDGKVRSLLGEARFADYKRAQDQSFQALYRLGLKLDLPTDAAADAYERKRAAEQAAQRIRSDRALDEASLRQQLAAVKSQAEADLEQTLGPEGLQTYRRNGGGWLRDLERLE